MVTLHVGSDVIECTARHPIWVVRGEDLQRRPLATKLTDKTGCWIEAQHLQPGDTLLTPAGEIPLTGLSTTFAPIDSCPQKKL
ncbi:MAG: hypothetical protein R3C18_10130 [Planctomycetaceae bacterium]